VKLLSRDRPMSDAASSYARAAMPAGRTPWREAEYCVVDLELSGLDPRRGEIISLGAVPVRDGRVVLEGALYGLARPLTAVPGKSVRIHGIRTLDLDGAPALDEAIDALLGAMAGRVLVAHAARVERAFLGPALRRRGVRLRGPVVDTGVIGRLWLYDRDGQVGRQISLGALAAALGLPAHRPHNALGDALTTAQAFLSAATHLDALRPETVRSLARAGDRLDAALLYPRHRC
jgi:DNA polymerase-3 subunit epsilon